MTDLVSVTRGANQVVAVTPGNPKVTRAAAQVIAITPAMRRISRASIQIIVELPLLAAAKPKRTTTSLYF